MYFFVRSLSQNRTVLQKYYHCARIIVISGIPRSLGGMGFSGRFAAVALNTSQNKTVWRHPPTTTHPPSPPFPSTVARQRRFQANGSLSPTTLYSGCHGNSGSKKTRTCQGLLPFLLQLSNPSVSSNECLFLVYRSFFHRICEPSLHAGDQRPLRLCSRWYPRSPWQRGSSSWFVSVSPKLASS